MASLVEAVVDANPTVLNDILEEEKEDGIKPVFMNMDTLAAAVTVGSLSHKQAPALHQIPEQQPQVETPQHMPPKAGRQDAARALPPPDPPKATPPKTVHKSLLEPRSSASRMMTRSASKKPTDIVSPLVEPDSIAMFEGRRLTPEERLVMDIDKTCPSDLEFARPFYVALGVSESTNQINESLDARSVEKL